MFLRKMTDVTLGIVVDTPKLFRLCNFICKMFRTEN